MKISFIPLKKHEWRWTAWESIMFDFHATSRSWPSQLLLDVRVFCRNLAPRLWHHQIRHPIDRVRRTDTLRAYSAARGELAEAFPDAFALLCTRTEANELNKTLQPLSLSLQPSLRGLPGPLPKSAAITDNCLSGFGSNVIGLDGLNRNGVRAVGKGGRDGVLMRRKRSRAGGDCS